MLGRQMPSLWRPGNGRIRQILVIRHAESPTFGSFVGLRARLARGRFDQLDRFSRFLLEFSRHPRQVLRLLRDLFQAVQHSLQPGHVCIVDEVVVVGHEGLRNRASCRCRVA
jgi:hypothetical protein